MVASARAKNQRRKKIKGKSKGKKQVHRDDDDDNDNDNENANIFEGLDCLSLLPDDILVEILSCLPIRDAIITGLLSQRWRYLWTQITSLTIDIYRHKKFFTQVLPQLTNIQEVKVLSIYTPRVSEHTMFINQIFRLSLLKVLELDRRGLLLGHSGYKLTLPTIVNLKVLKLRFDYDDDYHASLLNKLLNSCPLLEDFSLKINYPLKCSKVIIKDAPKVKYLRLDYSHLSNLFFANIIDLQKVDISGAFGTLNVDDQSCRLMNIFEVISKARSLSLGSPSLTMDARMPMLVSLVHLKCIVDCSMENTINLLTLLRKCPSLEVLILNFTPKFYGESLTHNSETLQCDLAPAFLVRLKRVEMNMRVHLLNGGAFYAVKYLLKSASVLERLIIDVTGYKNAFTGVTQCHELQICKDIFALPRKSLLCQVEYFGISLKSSDFERKLY